MLYVSYYYHFSKVKLTPLLKIINKFHGIVYVIFNLPIYLTPVLLQTCLLLLFHIFSVFHYTSGSPSLVLGIEVVVVSPENLFEIQILGPYSWPTESQIGGEVQHLVC